MGIILFNKKKKSLIIKMTLKSFRPLMGIILFNSIVVYIMNILW